MNRIRTGALAALFLALLVSVGACRGAQEQPSVVQGAHAAAVTIFPTRAAPNTTDQSTPAALSAAPTRSATNPSPTVAPSPSPIPSPIPSPTPTAIDTRLPLSRTINVLVLGSDRRPRMPNWRTDVMMIIAMDMEKGEAGVISIPRDVYLDKIPNHRPNRMNVVDYLGEQDEPGGGGPKLLASLIQEKMGVPIHYYLRFEFEGFKKVIDALGGLEIEIDCPAREYLIEEDVVFSLEPGWHRLSGEHALAYVRARNQGGDLERARRQQRVVWAVRNQVLQENLLPKLPALYAALKDTVQTDIGLITAIRFARFALSLDQEDIHGLVISPPDLVKEGWRGGMFVFIADWPKIAERVQTVFDRPPLIQTNTVGETGDRTRCP
ncbi:MAG: LytR family transcriptional regulator [Caldilineae bacterium]|nr:MAG: LytR family transcriptional regulator [Caldilineae bacterium]